MNFHEFVSAGVSVLADFSRDAAMAAGLSTARVRDLARVHHTYFGPTQFTRKQREALAAADGMPLDQAVLIERKLTAVGDAAERWRIRLDLVRHRGSYRALTKRIARLIHVPKQPPKPSCRFSRSKAGMRTMILTYNERDLADLEHLLRKLIDADYPAAAQMAHTLIGILRDGKGIPKANFRPIILVPIADWARIQSGTGDEVTLICTDGTTMTGAEYMEHEFGDVLEVAAFHPQEGPVNLYHAKRCANPKQKVMSKLLCPSCALANWAYGTFKNEPLNSGNVKIAIFGQGCSARRQTLYFSSTSRA